MSGDTGLPESWTTTTIGELTIKKIKQEPPSGEGDFTYIDIGSIDRDTKRVAHPKRLAISEAPSRARQVVSAGDVLVSMTRPNLNAVAIVPHQHSGAIATTGFDVLRSTGVDARWLYYLVQTHDFVAAMSFLVQGALYPAVRSDDVRSYRVPVAPLPEQRRIVDALETHLTRLDVAVSALERVRANLKRYRASVLQAACEGQSVPTEHELARREGRDYESADVLLERILEERRARSEGKYKEPERPDTSELPELPDGWVWATVGQLAYNVQYGHTASADAEAEGPRFLRITDIQNGRVNWNTVPGCEIKDKEIDKYRLSPGAIVFARTGATTGKSFLVRNCPDAIFASYLIRVQLVPELIRPEYVYLFFQSPDYWRQVEGGKRGIGQANVNATVLRGLTVPLPPAAEQDRIIGQIERHLSVAEAAEDALAASDRRAARLRQSILKRAFEGRLVPQDPSDEPASALLERIRAEREEQIELAATDGGG